MAARATREAGLRSGETRGSSAQGTGLAAVRVEGDRLTIGATCFDLRRVSGLRIATGESARLVANMASFSAFLLVGMFIVVGVFSLVWAPRFLIGTVVLAGVGLMGLQDSWLERKTGLYSVVITLPEGDREVFLTSVEAEARAVAAVIERVLPGGEPGSRP